MKYTREREMGIDGDQKTWRPTPRSPGVGVAGKGGELLEVDGSSLGWEWRFLRKPKICIYLGILRRFD
jgi:hypothetical protein